jgi:phosphate uptake regulator
MEYRKVQMIGDTYIISLPKEWAKHNGLKKGSLVALETGKGGKLIVYPFEKEEKRREVELCYPVASHTQLHNEITAAYLVGFDIIRVVGSERIDYKDREVIKELVRRFIGLEIVEEDANSITIQFLLQVETLDPKKMFKRMNLLTKGMYRDVITSLVENDPKLSKIVIERDDEVDRLYFLLVRLLRSVAIDTSLAIKLDLSPIEYLDFRVAATLLENVGDYAVDMAKVVLSEMRVNNKGVLLEIGRVLESIQENAVRAFLLRNRKDVEKILELYGKLDERVKVSEEANGSFEFHELIRKIAKCSIDLADLVMPLYPRVK